MSFSIKECFEKENRRNFELHEQHLNHQFVRVLKTLGFDKRYVRAEGCYLFDSEGNRYLDLLSGYGVYAFGRNHPRVIDLLKQTLDAGLPNLVQFDCPTLAGVLAERLLSYTPKWIDKAFFCNSGAEAVEGAIKFARAATRREKILYCSQAFHGLTNGALSLNGAQVFKDPFGKLLDSVQVPFDDIEAVEKELRKKEYAGFVVEPVQGKGVQIPSEAFLPEASRLCKKYGTLFIADEIQTGLGRTGKFFAFENWQGVEPDIITVAKALSGGFVPIGAILTRKSIFKKVFRSMEHAVIHSSTFSRNNLAMAAGLAALEVIEDEALVQRASDLGARLLKQLQDRLEKYELVKEVRGKGMMIGVEFGPPKKLSLRTAWTLLEKANKGLFCQMIVIPLFRDHRILTQVAGPSSYTIKLIPPLTLSHADIEETVQAFDQVVSEAHRFPGAVWDLGTTLAGHAMKARAN